MLLFDLNIYSALLPGYMAIQLKFTFFQVPLRLGVAM